MSPRQTNAQMSDSTRKELIRKARQAFAQHGYAQAPIEEVVRACGLTRGALYHHFGSKQGLFLAVVRQIDQEILEGILAAEPDLRLEPVEQFLLACRSYLEATLEPSVRRILLLDAPAVLATLPDAAEASRTVETSLAPLRDGLAHLQDLGQLKACDLDVAARMLGGALFEAATWLGATAHPGQGLDPAMQVLTLMMGGLTQQGAHRRGKPAG
jgi:AcrR family transcriptional regulator